MLRVLLHGVIAVLLTVLTQIGGLIWLLSRVFPRPILSFAVLYIAVSLATPLVSARVPLPCWSNGPLQSQSVLYCALNRHYVTPEMLEVAQSLATEMDSAFPGTITQTLDGNFPFFDGFPLLPHLSHDDGEKLDFAFYWSRDGTYLPGRNRSPIGYWGYADGPTDCPTRPDDLRWDFVWLNAQLPALDIDKPRLRHALRHLSNDPAVGKILIEPHLLSATNLSHPKLRFQGCRAARHDDHIHIQL